MVRPFMRDFHKQDIMIASGLFLLGLLTRIPFAGDMIYHSDSVRFALAMKQYDVGQMRPHAPGYIIYVALAKFIDFFTDDARTSLIGISVFASAATLSVLYLLAKKMYGKTNGIICCLILLTSPLFWFNGEMPFTYALEGLLCTIFGLTCYGMLVGEKKWLFFAAISMGLATGVRQHIIIMFLPMWLYALKNCSIKQIVISFLIFGVVCLAWFIPMIMFSGGLTAYLTALEAQYMTWVVHPAPILFKLKLRGAIFLKFIIYSFGLGLFPMIYYFGYFFKPSAIVNDTRLKFICLWIFPLTLFYIGFNLYNPGHIVVLLPPVFIYLADSIRGLSIDFEDAFKNIFSGNLYKRIKFLKMVFSFKSIAYLTTVILIVINIWIFLFKDTPVSYAAIQKGDLQLAELVRLTEKNFDNKQTAILACRFSTQAGFYLPDYRIYCPFPLIFSESELPIDAQNLYISFHYQTTPKTFWIPTNFEIEPIALPAGIDTLVLWEKELSEYYQVTNRPLKEIDSTITDDRIYYLSIEPGERIYYDYHYLTVK